MKRGHRTRLGTFIGNHMVAAGALVLFLAACAIPSEQWQTKRMRVTAYCPCTKCCGENAAGVTACGHRIRPGDNLVAADPRYTFGTEMIIAGYNDGKPVKVLDRGGAIKGDRLDVFFHSHRQALEWGVRYIEVKVLTK